MDVCLQCIACAIGGVGGCLGLWLGGFGLVRCFVCVCEIRAWCGDH